MSTDAANAHIRIHRLPTSTWFGLLVGRRPGRPGRPGRSDMKTLMPVAGGPDDDAVARAEVDALCKLDGRPCPVGDAVQLVLIPGNDLAALARALKAATPR